MDSLREYLPDVMPQNDTINILHSHSLCWNIMIAVKIRTNLFAQQHAAGDRKI